MVRNTS